VTGALTAHLYFETLRDFRARFIDKNKASNRMPDMLSKMIASRPASAAWRLS